MTSPLETHHKKEEIVGSAGPRRTKKAIRSRLLSIYTLIYMKGIEETNLFENT